MVRIIQIGGLLHLAMAAFHLAFWRLLRWKEDLAHLSSANRAVVQILNLCLTFIFVAFGYLSLFHTEELLTTNLGHAMLAFITLFRVLRVIEQIVFFRIRDPLSVELLAAFLAGVGLYGYPLFVVLTET